MLVKRCLAKPQARLRPHLRGAVAPRSGYDLEACFREWANNQGRQHTLAADGCGEFLQGCIVKDAARIGLRFIQLRQRKVAVLGGIDNGRSHFLMLLSSG